MMRERANSATGTRTRVARVRAEYPNQLDYSGFWLAKVCHHRREGRTRVSENIAKSGSTSKFAQFRSGAFSSALEYLADYDDRLAGIRASAGEGSGDSSMSGMADATSSEPLCGVDG